MKLQYAVYTHQGNPLRQCVELLMKLQYAVPHQVKLSVMLNIRLDSHNRHSGSRCTRYIKCLAKVKRKLLVEAWTMATNCDKTHYSMLFLYP